MERIEEKKGICSYGWRPGTYNNRNIEYIEKSDIDRVQKFIDTIYISDGALSDGSKVFFDEKVLFPRKRFKSDYPNVRRVISPERADIIIVQKSKLMSEFKGLWTQQFYHLHGADDTFTQDPGHPSVDTSRANIEAYVNWRGSCSELVGRMNKILSYDGKKIIDLSNITMHGEEEFTDVAFSKITKMLSAVQEDVRIMGLTMLTAYDYASNKEKIALILKLNQNTVRMTRKNLSVDIKSLLERSNCDYGNLSTPSFVVRTCIKNPKNKLYEVAFNEWLRKTTYDNDLPYISINLKSEENGNSEESKEVVNEESN